MESKTEAADPASVAGGEDTMAAALASLLKEQTRLRTDHAATQAEHSARQDAVTALLADVTTMGTKSPEEQEALVARIAASMTSSAGAEAEEDDEEERDESAFSGPKRDEKKEEDGHQTAEGSLIVGTVVVVTNPGTSESRISRVVEVLDEASDGESKEGGGGGRVGDAAKKARVQMLGEDDEATVLLKEVRRLGGTALGIAEAAMEGDIGRVLSLASEAAPPPADFGAFFTPPNGTPVSSLSKLMAQGALCLALYNLARIDAKKVVIVEQGGIAALIAAMGWCAGDAKVQEWGCLALSCLARKGEYYKWTYR
jgi:hypothetical protein